MWDDVNKRYHLIVNKRGLKWGHPKHMHISSIIGKALVPLLGSQYGQEPL